MARNDAAKRANNAALRPGDVWAEKERWMPCVLEVQERMKTRGAQRPAGLPAGGTLVLNNYMLVVTGYIKWILRYEIGGQYVVIGGFVTEYLLDDDRPRMPMKPLKTHGREVVIGCKKGGNELERQVRVLIDGDGLPVPVPPEVWNAMGLA